MAGQAESGAGQGHGGALHAGRREEAQQVARRGHGRPAGAQRHGHRLLAVGQLGGPFLVSVPRRQVDADDAAAAAAAAGVARGRRRRRQQQRLGRQRRHRVAGAVGDVQRVVHRRVVELDFDAVRQKKWSSPV